MRPSSATLPVLLLSQLLALAYMATYANAACAQALFGAGGSLGVTSDYVYRGISVSSGRPAVQADVHYQGRSGWILGAWGSHADLPQSEGVANEVDIYVGRNWSITPDWEMRTTLTHYTYPNDPRTVSYDYDELINTVAYRSQWFATVAWTPNLTRYSQWGSAHNAHAFSYELSALQPLAGPLAATAGIGFFDLPADLDADYWFWNIGLACAVGRAQLTFAYMDTDDKASRAFGYESTGGRWAGSVAWRF